MSSSSQNPTGAPNLDYTPEIEAEITRRIKVAVDEDEVLTMEQMADILDFISRFAKNLHPTSTPLLTLDSIESSSLSDVLPSSYFLVMSKKQYRVMDKLWTNLLFPPPTQNTTTTTTCQDTTAADTFVWKLLQVFHASFVIPPKPDKTPPITPSDIQHLRINVDRDNHMDAIILYFEMIGRPLGCFREWVLHHHSVLSVEQRSYLAKLAYANITQYYPNTKDYVPLFSNTGGSTLNHKDFCQVTKFFVGNAVSQVFDSWLLSGFANLRRDLAYYLSWCY